MFFLKKHFFLSVLVTSYNPVFKGTSPRGYFMYVFHFCHLILFSGRNRFLLIVQNSFIDWEIVHGYGIEPADTQECLNSMSVRKSKIPLNLPKMIRFRVCFLVSSTLLTKLMVIYMSLDLLYFT